MFKQVLWAVLIVAALAVPVVFGWVEADRSAQALRIVAYCLIGIGWVGAVARSLPVFMTGNVAGILVLAAPYVSP
ncbi:MAG: hypothetical protein RLO06_05425 [Parvibaculum sp.]